jgi:hypothetical protein
VKVDAVAVVCNAIIALIILGACSGSNGDSSASVASVTLNAGPRKAAPDGLYGKRWRSRPTHDVKLFAPPTDGVAVYVPTEPPAAFEGIPVAEADLEYDNGRLWSGDLYIDGADRRDAVRDALLRLYGSPDPEPSTGNDYSWSWPKRHIAVDMRFDASHGRTTVAFSSSTKDRSTDQIAVPSDMDALRADDLSKSAQNMKLAVLDGNRKEACSNAKSLYYDGRGLAQSGVIDSTQRKAMNVAEEFIRDQCPR